MMLPYPISTNLYWRTYRGRVVVSAEATAYKKSVALAAMLDGVRILTGDVSVEYTLHPRLTKEGEPSKVRIDLDNALKVVGDALNGVAYIDDKQVIEIHAKIGHPQIGGGITVCVRQSPMFRAGRND